jgi:hypothetical protein
MGLRMNTIRNLEFSCAAPQRLMNAGGMHNADGHAKVWAPAIRCMFGSRKHLPTFNTVFKERFGNSLIL